VPSLRGGGASGGRDPREAACRRGFGKPKRILLVLWFARRSSSILAMAIELRLADIYQCCIQRIHRSGRAEGMHLPPLSRSEAEIARQLMKRIMDIDHGPRCSSAS